LFYRAVYFRDETFECVADDWTIEPATTIR